MADLHVNWDEVREGAGKAAGFTKEKAGVAYDLLKERLESLEAEKRRNIYLGAAICCGMVIMLIVVYFKGRRDGRRRAIMDAGEWD
ncbi:MAG: hypothetical protein IJT34_11530 [Butyrivibrio sp.]|nr:hypothetical protein [Butyrivibrio sp.]